MHYDYLKIFVYIFKLYLSYVFVMFYNFITKFKRFHFSFVVFKFKLRVILAPWTLQELDGLREWWHGEKESEYWDDG